MARNRIIYASQSVWANGEVLYRVQSLGSTTTFTSEDIFELGHLDIIDVVDDVPAVAITLNTNDFGDVETMAILAQVKPAKRAMDATADDTTGNLVVVSGTNLTETSTFLHGACLSDFAITCGNLPGVSLWAPVQDECSLGTLADDIDQSLFMDEVFINSLEFSYSTGANATENYGAETDNKMWLLNDGKFINYEEPTIVSGTTTVDLTLTDSVDTVATLSNGIGFLRKDAQGAPAVTVYDAAADTMVNWPIVVGAATATQFGYNATTHVISVPTGMNSGEFLAGDRLEIVYAADAYGTAAADTYFNVLATTDRPSSIGAVRQGQVEVFIVANDDVSYQNAWRLTGCTISADLTREPLSELGHLGPYDRPLTLPIPITVTVDSTAGDLENWAKVANKIAGYDALTLDQLELKDLMASESLKLVVKIYGQTDEEAGGTGSNRTIAVDSPFIGQDWWYNGVMNDNTAGSDTPQVTGVYAAADREYPLKTIIIEHLKITDEGSTLDVGTNATQTFGFRSTNDLYVVKGEVSIENITGDFKVRRNA